MSIASVWSFLWKHRPTEEQIDSVSQIAKAAEAFIELLKDKLPELEGKRQSLELASQSLSQANLVLAKAAQDAAPPPQVTAD